MKRCAPVVAACRLFSPRTPDLPLQTSSLPIAELNDTSRQQCMPAVGLARCDIPPTMPARRTARSRRGSQLATSGSQQLYGRSLDLPRCPLGASRLCSSHHSRLQYTKKRLQTI